ncbi:MAG: transposase [Bacteroidota bacterium]
MSTYQGRPCIDARRIIGAMIIKHKLVLSDEETVMQIQENPYLQYFLGYANYEAEQVFSPTLFVEIRKRIGAEKFNEMSTALIKTALKGDMTDKEKRKRIKKSISSNQEEGTEENREDSARDEVKENNEQFYKEKERRKKQYRERIPIEGKFGQGKNGYRLNYIRAKLPETSKSWIGSIFFVMNLMNLNKKN